MVEYDARCHCGALRSRWATSIAPSQWSIRACQCSFCRAHGALATADPAGLLTFVCALPERLQYYRFGSGSTNFLICRECGVYVGAHTAGERGRFGIINVRTLRLASQPLADAVPMDYSGETPQARYARRAARWTPLSQDSV